MPWPYTQKKVATILDFPSAAAGPVALAKECPFPSRLLSISSVSPREGEQTTGGVTPPQFNNMALRFQWGICAGTILPRIDAGTASV